METITSTTRGDRGAVRPAAADCTVEVHHRRAVVLAPTDIDGCLIVYEVVDGPQEFVAQYVADNWAGAAIEHHEEG